MQHLIKKIVGEDLQKHIVSSKFCKINSRSCVIGGKFGLVNIDLSSYPAATGCQLKFKKISGNGLITIIGENRETTSHSIVSKVSESINVNILDSKKFNVLRPASGIGDIELIAIVLTSGEMVQEKIADLRTELSKCSCKGIRSVGSRYFTNEGSKIVTSDVVYIETEPPGMFSIKGNEVIFAGISEIIKFKVGKPVEKALPDFVQSVQRGSELVPAQRNTDIRSLGYETSLERALSFDYKPSESNIINSNKDVCVFSDGMTLGRYGAINIPKLSLKDSSKYVLLIKCKNIDGNGRLTINISNTNLQDHSVYAGPDDLIKIKFLTNSDDFNISVGRGGPSTGNVWISRISIAPYSVIYGDINEYVGIRASGQNDIEYTSKRFSLIKKEVFNAPELFTNVSGIIAARGFSANSWLNKIQPLFPNIKIKSDSIRTPILDEEPDILIGELGDLKKVKKIWLNEFQGITISNHDLEILKGAKVISSCLPNVQFLRNHHNINITYLPKVWPYIEPNIPENKSYILMFNRNTAITKSFIDMHKGSNLPQLIVPGLRGNVPAHVISVSEYLDYKTLLGLILYASAIVDIPVCTHYMSAILDMAFIAGVPIITTNQWLSISKPTCYQIPVEMKNGKICPNLTFAIQKTADALKAQSKKNKFDMSSYNLNLYGSVKTAMEL